MPDLAKYKKNLAASGPELILEVASEDLEISDADYKALHAEVSRLRSVPRAYVKKMADRDAARAELNKDYVQ